jgi:uncharacterized protein YjbI with pentapeptide repeats
MANPGHIEILKQGVETWNRWRTEHTAIMPDLSYAELGYIDLSHVDLRGAYLPFANLCRSDLRSANFNNATLSSADLSFADINYADFSHADLNDVDLRKSYLRGANFYRGDLRNSDLRRAYLERANLSRVNLSRANLSRANLAEANLTDADLRGTNISESITSHTVLSGNDLREVAGLESVRHQGPSEISVSTIYLSKGEIPLVFLRGCGVPEDLITYMRSLTATAIEFYSCFISYSSKDQKFAERLHADLQSKGVRVWFAPHDMKIGARIRPTIDESIRVYDKLLLVLSEHSVSSQWVEQEVETALAREREQEGRTVLFPVRIDDTVMESKAGWPALLKNTRNVGEFTDWKDHDSYLKAFDRLLRDLRAGA